MIVGVDSYLNATSIDHYLVRERLLTKRNSNGFIPGEAAAAVLCARKGGPMQVSGLGLAREKAYIYNEMDIPFKGEGMATAYKVALAESDRLLSDVGIQIGDFIGETFWFEQAALATMRIQRVRSPMRPIWGLGASMGNIGAASGPAMLAWALSAIRNGYVPIGPILMEASGDNGACGAAVLEAA